MQNTIEVGFNQTREMLDSNWLFGTTVDFKIGDFLVVEGTAYDSGLYEVWIVESLGMEWEALESVRSRLFVNWSAELHPRNYEIWHVCDDADCWQAWEHDVAQTRGGFTVDNVRTVDVVPYCDRDEGYAYGLVRADWHDNDNGVSGETSCIVYLDGLVIVNPGWNDVQPETLDDALWSHEISRAGWEPLGYVDWHDCSCNRDGSYVWESQILDWLRDYANEIGEGDEGLRASRLRRAGATTC